MLEFFLCRHTLMALNDVGCVLNDFYKVLRTELKSFDFLMR